MTDPVPLFSATVTGTTFFRRRDLINSCLAQPAYHRIQLVHEPDNAYDHRAIQVRISVLDLIPETAAVGYLARTQTTPFHEVLALAASPSFLECDGASLVRAKGSPLRITTSILSLKPLEELNA